MVFHYFDGFGPKWIALVITAGGALASGATYVYRGGGKSYIDEIGMQDSESVLAPTTKSMKNKIGQVPQSQNEAILKNATSSAEPDATSAGIDRSSYNSKNNNEQLQPKFSYKSDAENNNNDSSSSTVAASPDHTAVSQLKQKLAEANQQAAILTKQVGTWISENPKTTISIAVLLYIIQHLARKVIAHQRYEDRLLAEKRISNQPIESSSSAGGMFSPQSTSSLNTGTASSSNYNNSNTNSSQMPPSAISVEEEARLQQQQQQYEVNLPASTWASKARPLHADPEFEKLVGTLTVEMIQEFTKYLFPDVDLEEDQDIVRRVKDEILSIAPESGWSGRIVHLEEGKKNNNKDDEIERVFRFFDRRGEQASTEVKVHGDAVLAFDLIQREVSRRSGKRLTDELEKSVTKTEQ